MQPRTGAALSVVGMLVLVLGALISGSWLVAAFIVGPFLVLGWSAAHYGRASRSPSS